MADGRNGQGGRGGGGTVAKFIAQTGAEVLDVGPPVMAMHSPFELLHVADFYSAYKGYKTFLEKHERPERAVRRRVSFTFTTSNNRRDWMCS